MQSMVSKAPKLRTRVARSTAFAVTGLLVATASLVSATAAVNGPIAYMRFVGDDAQLMLVEPDSSDTRQVPVATSGFLPLLAWSPDGTRLVLSVFTTDTLRPMLVDPSSGATHVLDVPGATSELALLCRSWAPDGTRIYCQGDSFSALHPEVSGVYSIRPDGSDLMRITRDVYPPIFTDRGTCGGGDIPGGVSPDGSRLVVMRARCGSGPVPDRNQRGALFVVNTNGTGFRQITPFGTVWSHDEGVARWSPDGSKILFADDNGDLTTIAPDGSGRRKIDLDLPGDRPFAIAPDWSPDGTRIVFDLFVRGGPSGIYTAAADGSHLALLVGFDDGFADYADWGPRP